jgi:ribosomal-protein-alanine N-acetyltransferase
LINNIIASTSRLIIREINEDDYKFFIELVNSPGWLKNIGDRKITNVELAKDYIQKNYINSYKKNGFGLWCLVVKENNMPIGICGLVKREYLPDVDLGYALLPQFFGLGYALESANGVLKIAKQTFNIAKLMAITLQDNLPSINLLLKLGFKFDSTFTDSESLEELNLYHISLNEIL